MVKWPKTWVSVARSRDGRESWACARGRGSEGRLPTQNTSLFVLDQNCTFCLTKRLPLGCRSSANGTWPGISGLDVTSRSVIPQVPPWGQSPSFSWRQRLHPASWSLAWVVGNEPKAERRGSAVGWWATGCVGGGLRHCPTNLSLHHLIRWARKAGTKSYGSAPRANSLCQQHPNGVVTVGLSG